MEKCVNLLKMAGDNFILTEPNNEERKLDSKILERYFEDKKKKFRMSLSFRYLNTQLFLKN